MTEEQKEKLAAQRLVHDRSVEVVDVDTLRREQRDFSWDWFTVSRYVAFDPVSAFVRHKHHSILCL